MKNTILLFTLFVIVPFFSFSQKIYVKTGAGKNWASGSSYIVSNVSVNKVGIETHVTEEIVKGTFSTGFASSFIIGYSFKDNFAVEGGFSYVSGNTYEGIRTDEDANRTTETRTYHSRVPAGSLALVLQANNRKLTPYLKAGVILAKPQIYFSNVDESNPLNTYELETVAYGNLAIGLQGGVGFNYKLNEKLGIYVESNFTSMTYSPAEQKILKYEVGGVDRYSSIPDYLKKNIYKEKVIKYYRENGEERQDTENSYRTQLEYQYAMGAIGLQVGIHFNF